MTQQRSIFYRLIPAAMLAGLAGCAAIPKMDQAATPPPAHPQPKPPEQIVAPAKPWDARPLDTGRWRYDPRAKSATYANGSSALISFACSGSSIRIASDYFSAGGQAMTVDLKSSFGNNRLRFDPLGANGLQLSLPAQDQKLDQIAFSRGRFALEAANGRALTLPVHAEIGRVIEDCRG